MSFCFDEFDILRFPMCSFTMSGFIMSISRFRRCSAKAAFFTVFIDNPFACMSLIVFISFWL